MAASEDFNLRVHVYGTQGSGSVFPSKAERHAFQRRADVELLTLVLEDLATRADDTGRISFRMEDLIGGAIGPRTVARYVDRFEAKEPRVYGGWTTCLRIETGDGYDLVFDCGSGFRNCARDLQEKWDTRPERHLLPLRQPQPPRSHRRVRPGRRLLRSAQPPAHLRQPPVPPRARLQPRDLLAAGRPRRAGRADADLLRCDAGTVPRDGDRRDWRRSTTTRNGRRSHARRTTSRRRSGSARRPSRRSKCSTRRRASRTGSSMADVSSCSAPITNCVTATRRIPISARATRPRRA